jgi:protocatechuate 3,4-dioxygenase beta subunit
LAKDGTKSNVQNVPPATSDDSGRFTLKNLLSEGAYDVTVEAENFARGFFRRINVNTLNNTFVLQNGGSVSGMVKRLENNQPVKRVGMIVMSEDERFPYVAQALTNEKGLYAFLGVPPGAYTVAVNSTSLTAADYKGVKVESNKDVTGIDFLVYQGLTVNGKVVDSATGTAVADAEVKARARVGAFLEASTKLSTHTDDDGTFVMKNLRAGIYYFTATAEGYLKINDVAKQQRIELSLNKPPPFVKIKVYRGGEVNGKVINEAGSTLPFAFVQLFQSPQTPTQINTRELQATTDISGNFTINGIWIAQPVELYASAFAQGYAKGKSDQVILTDYSPSASITVTLRKGILLTGTVSDSEKKPISGATISASPVMFEGDSFTAPYATISSESGEYQIANVPAGKAWVDATAPGYVPYRKKIEFSSDEQIKKLDIVLSKGLIITGYVMDDLGRPIENADVSVSNPSGAGRPGKSDAIGFYQILDLENRHYDLIAGCSRNTATGSQSYYSQRRDIPAGRESVSFVFLINASLQGRVVNQNSVPIQRFGISISAQVDTGDGTTGGFSTGKNFNDATGEFHLTDLPTGSYDLVFSADGCAKLELRDIRVDSPSSRQLGDIELQDGGKLQARIISSLTGEPVAGAGGTLEPQPGGQGSSNLDGILTINSLAAGSYNLSITHSHYLSCIVSPVVIAEDQTTDLGDITLTPGGIIEGFVSDGDGAPLQGITVSAEGGYGSPHLSGQTDIGGHYFIDGVQEGLTTVRAEGTVHGQKCFKSRVVNILADDRAKVDFVLDPSCNIAGRIYSAAFSLHNMLVVAYQVDESNHIDDAMKTVGSIAAEGTYRISDIVAGEYFLTAEGKVMNPPQGVPSRIIRTFERLSVYNTETLRDIEFSNARVEGIIVARSDGTPIQRAQLKLIYNDGPAAPSQIANRYFVFAARSNNDGFFWFYGLPPGHYDLYAARPSGTWEHCESIYLSHRAAVSEITCSIE